MSLAGGLKGGAFTYYLSNLGHSIAGTGNADGSVIERLDYTSGGDFVEAGGTTCTLGDVNADGHIDGLDIAAFLNVLFGYDADPIHVCAADVDMANDKLPSDAVLVASRAIANELGGRVSPKPVLTRAILWRSQYSGQRRAQTEMCPWCVRRRLGCLCGSLS